MKKIILSVAAVFAFGIASAQDEAMKFGAKAGFASLSSKVEGGGFSATASETGFQVGVFAEFGISEKFDFKPEVLYVSAGDLNQVQVPMHFRYEVAEGFGILAGPNLAFLMDVADGFKSLNYGADLGLSYDITESLVIDARYNFGLANLSETDGVDMHLSGIYAGIGYRF